ncbi:MAG: hypothetical protein ACFE85_03965 [Candidatus Hodarchaeota archaeon]
MEEHNKNNDIKNPKILIFNELFSEGYTGELEILKKIISYYNEVKLKILVKRLIKASPKGSEINNTL